MMLEVRNRVLLLVSIALLMMSLMLLTTRVYFLEQHQKEDRDHVDLLIAHEEAESVELDEVLALEKKHDVMLAECIRGCSGDHDPVRQEVEDKAR